MDSSELDQLLEALADAETEIDDSSELEDWEKLVLRQGLDKAFFIIKYFEFFGNDIFISSLIDLRFRTETIASSSASKQHPNRKLAALGVFLLLATEVAIRPAEVGQAIDYYQGLYNKLTKNELPLLSAPPKQIEGPRDSV